MDPHTMTLSEQSKLCCMAKVEPALKRRYNLCYRARKIGYTVDTAQRTMYRGIIINERIEKDLYAYGFNVQLKLFHDNK